VPVDPADQLLAVGEGSRVGAEQQGVEAQVAAGLVRPGRERTEPALCGGDGLLGAALLGSGADPRPDRPAYLAGRGVPGSNGLGCADAGSAGCGCGAGTTGRGLAGQQTGPVVGLGCLLGPDLNRIQLPTCAAHLLLRSVQLLVGGLWRCGRGGSCQSAARAQDQRGAHGNRQQLASGHVHDPLGLDQDSFSRRARRSLPGASEGAGPPSASAGWSAA